MKFLLWIPLVSALLLAACTTSAPESPVMPPEPPQNPVSSTIFTPTPTPVPPPTLPEGFSMLLGDQPVTFTDLSPQPPDQESPTIVVRAPASTPFRKVSNVLESLHELGYRVAFATDGDHE